MSDAIIVGVLFLIVVAASTFYLYSRLIYSERKIGLMENILLDIKMSMEMEREIVHGHGHEHEHSNKMEQVHIHPSEDAPVEATFEDVTKDDAEFYNSALENAPIESEEIKPSNVLDTPIDMSNITDALTRDELVSIAEKKGLRVTKRATKQQILSLLRDTDKNTSEVLETGTDGPVGGASGSVEGATLLSDESVDNNN